MGKSDASVRREFLSAVTSLVRLARRCGIQEGRLSLVQLLFVLASGGSDDGSAAQVLGQAGLGAERLSQQVAPIDATGTGEIRLDGEVRLLLERALRYQRQFGADGLRTEHLLLALLDAEDAQTRRLVEMETTVERLRRSLLELIESSGGQTVPQDEHDLSADVAVSDAVRADLEALGLEPNALGHDPLQRRPWTRAPLAQPGDRRSFLVDADGWPVQTVSGRCIDVSSSGEIILLAH